MANFFIRRPIVAIRHLDHHRDLWDFSRLKGLSVEQYPFLAPPIDPGHGDLPGRVRGSGRTIGCDPHRARGQRR